MGKFLGHLTGGLFGPSLFGGGEKTTTIIQQPAPVEEPQSVAQQEEMVDPDALDRAAERARDAELRKNRRRLRIPLGTGGTGSGLQLT